MRIAQQLYEGVDIKGSGTVGLITYLRTDSTRISEEADHGSTNLCQEQLRRKLCVPKETTSKKAYQKDPGCA